MIIGPLYTYRRTHFTSVYASVVSFVCHRRLHEMYRG